MVPDPDGQPPPGTRPRVPAAPRRRHLCVDERAPSRSSSEPGSALRSPVTTGGSGTDRTTLLPARITSGHFDAALTHAYGATSGLRGIPGAAPQGGVSGSGCAFVGLLRCEGLAAKPIRDDHRRSRDGDHGGRGHGGDVAGVGVRRVYGLPGDSLNGFTDALRRDGGIAWEHVRHEEAAAFAAAAEAALTGELAVCAGSCGPGNLHLINGLFDANRSRVPVLAIAAHIPRTRSAGSTSRRPTRRSCSASAASTASWSASRSRCRGVLEMAMRAALAGGGVAVVVIPGECSSPTSPRGAKTVPVRPATPVIRPDDDSLAAAAEVLNAAQPRHDPGRGGVRGRPRAADRPRGSAAGAGRARAARQGVHRVRQPLSTSA